jgi:uncharacterized membrane protein (DUF373 family)
VVEYVDQVENQMMLMMVEVNEDYLNYSKIFHHIVEDFDFVLMMIEIYYLMLDLVHEEYFQG